MNTQTHASLYCRPHLNGNTPADFREGGAAIVVQVQNLQELLTEQSGQLLHGRNYQHLNPVEACTMRALDIAKMRHIHQWLNQIRDLGYELHKRGED